MSFETKQEYHNRMKPMKEAYDKFLKEMMNTPYSYEEAIENQRKLKENRIKEISSK